jgi:type III restriction enzyme
MNDDVELEVDDDLLALISHQMELRQPNADAVTDIAVAITDHFDRLGRVDTFEGVVVSATGVGKTYVLAGTIDYLAQARGWNNFMVVVPGRTIREKTIANFTPGSSRDLTKLLGVKTVLITADNFETPEMARAMADSEVVKVYVLTVQILLKPSPQMNRKTREFTEGLGAKFYDWLAAADDLVVLADEHHLYYGEKFSEAIRGLTPRAIIGLTATPNKKTDSDEIIFRYPLAAAIADKFVKTPVIVGRKDDRNDLITRLNDGLTLLECKRNALDAFLASAPDLKPINPFMLIVAKDTTEADEIASILRASDFREGTYANAVIQVDSSVTEDKEPDMWQRLADVDSPSSPVRVVVSVAMLKEGWDVKSVYVLMSTQPSLSNVLTEQVLGRGLRLPFGAYTGVEMLDTLEVLAHEKFSSLLDRAGVLNEAFVSYRTRTRIVEDQNGDATVRQVQDDVDVRVGIPVGGDSLAGDESVQDEWGGDELNTPGFISVANVDGREAASIAAVDDLRKPSITLMPDAPNLILPRLSQRPTTRRFSLSTVTNEDAFTGLGKTLRSNPDDELRRMRLTAVRVTGPDGIVRSETRQVTAQDPITSRATLDMPLDVSRDALVAHVMGLPMVDSGAASRSVERANAKRLVDLLIDGLGDDAEKLLAAYGGRAAVRLGRLIQAEQRKTPPQVAYDDHVDFFTFAPNRRLGDRNVTNDINGKFDKKKAYSGWKKSLIPTEWFDSSPELEVARMLDETKDLKWWVRLQLGDLTIAWGSGQRYNPDFLVSDGAGNRALLEVKADNEMDAASVLAKRQSAKAWVNYANGLPQVEDRGEKWSYLLVSETDITQAKGSWDALKRFG